MKSRSSIVAASKVFSTLKQIVDEIRAQSVNSFASIELLAFLVVVLAEVDLATEPLLFVLEAPPVAPRCPDYRP